MLLKHNLIDAEIQNIRFPQFAHSAAPYCSPVKSHSAARGKTPEIREKNCLQHIKTTDKISDSDNHARA